MTQVVNMSSGYPLEETDGNARPLAQRQDTSSSYDGNSRARDRKNGSRRTSDAYNVQSDTEGAKQRRTSLRTANVRKRSRNQLRDKSKENADAPSVDDSAWIHRDKLAQIEIQEMEAAGIHVRQPCRSLSAGPGASASRRSSRSDSRSHKAADTDGPTERHIEDEIVPAYSGYDDFERKRISTIAAADEEENDFDPYVDTEFRSAEEIAAAEDSARHHTIRPSTSRIPVSKASPMPVSQNVVGRESPLPRSRHGSGVYSGNWDDMQYARRARAGSVGSQVLLDDDVRTPSRPSSSHMQVAGDLSPTKTRTSSKPIPNSINVKNSTPVSATRPPSSSKTSPRAVSSQPRPASRSGHKSRPSTSHQYAPEGEAPWIASMYKPDPRLPPDQQMLPTHAKRMMQEQWEKEGRTSTAYDRDLRPLVDRPLPNKPLPSPIVISSYEPEDNDQRSDTNPAANSATLAPWPLDPRSDTRSETSSRPGTSGGYKITPTITTPPAIQKSPSLYPPQRSPQQRDPPPRVPDLGEKDEPQQKKGGCGCCIVM